MSMGRRYTGSLLNNNTYGTPFDITGITQRNLRGSPYISNELGQQELERRMQSENLNAIRNQQGDIISTFPVTNPGYIGGGRGGDQFTMDNIDLFTPPLVEEPTPTRPDIPYPMYDVTGEELTPEEEIVGTSGIDTSQETFMQQNQAEYPSFATPEKQKETKDKLFKLGDIFDNKEALGKIALGVALLEGTPIDDAFEMYENLSGTQAENLEIEVYDTLTGQVVGQGAFENMTLRNLTTDPDNNGRYRLQNFGDNALSLSKREDSRLAQIFDNNASLNKEIYFPALASSQTAIADSKRLLKIAEDPNFKSGKLEEISLPARQFLVQLGATAFDAEKVTTQREFETIISRLIPNIRPKGAGATSDFEITLYRKALPSLGDSPETIKKVLNEYIKAATINQERANYVIQNSEKFVDVSSTKHATDFNLMVNNVERSIKDDSPIEINQETRKALGDIYTFISQDELSAYGDSFTIPDNYVITL